MAISMHHVSLSVRELDRSIRFYEKLGLALESRRDDVTNDYFRKVIGYPDGVVHTAMLTCGSAVRLELMQYVVPKGETLNLATPNVGSAHICFIVADIRQQFERLRADGVVCRSEPVAIDAGPNRGAFAVYVLDPDGYTMELLQPPAGEAGKAGKAGDGNVRT